MARAKRHLVLLWLLSVAFLGLVSVGHAEAPNVIVILSDDQGWGDVGFNGGSDIPTPNLDALAKEGIVFSQGYATHPYCSPSRAGLLSGRYQHRFGHENNTPYHDPGENDGLPLDEVLISEVMEQGGYQTVAIGKWHLGDHKKFWPNNRGFKDWFGFYGGGLDYWGQLGKKPPETGVLRDGEVVPIDSLSYLTDDFSKEATKYIQRYTAQKKPFFMYLAYNAPHAPIQSPKRYLQQVSHIEDGKRAAYGAMVVAMDHGIGKVVAKLKETGAYGNTLIVFYSDNGAHIHGASSAPFRGHKGMLFEGGIRVPFLMSWPKKLEGGKRYHEAITALDIFPTVLAASGVKGPKKSLDGVNLLPYLQGKIDKAPHKTLYWRYSDGAGYAVRHQQHKLIYTAYKKTHLLFDMDKDPYEQNNLATVEAEKVKELEALYQQWSRGTVPGLWQDPHLKNVDKEEKRRQWFIDQASKGEKG